MNLFIIAAFPAVVAALAVAGCHRNADRQVSNAPPANPQVAEPAPPTTQPTGVRSLAGTKYTPDSATDQGALPPLDGMPGATAVTPPPGVDPTTNMADNGVTALPGTDALTAPAVPEPSTNSDNMTPAATTGAAPAVVPDNAFAVATLQGAPGSRIAGTVRFTVLSASSAADVRVLATLTDASPGEHGIHIHDKGDCSAFASGSAGEHWNPASTPHGAPVGDARHAGDLGNIIADANGAGTLSTTLPAVKGVSDMRTAFIGKAVVIHERADDLKSQPSGNSGTPVACGVIKDVTVMEAH